jgi:hypothetical protein
MSLGDWRLNANLRMAAMKNLESLMMQDTPITDAGLVHLRGLTSLRELHVQNTAVGDKGLIHLEGLSNLKDLQIWNTQVTEEGLQQLEQAIPDLIVSVKWPRTRTSQPTK